VISCRKITVFENKMNDLWQKKQKAARKVQAA
jgi:hypothetical protein